MLTYPRRFVLSGRLFLVIRVMSLDFTVLDTDFSVLQALEMMDSDKCDLSINDLQILSDLSIPALLEQVETRGRSVDMGSTGSSCSVSESGEDFGDGVVSVSGTYGNIPEDLVSLLSGECLDSDLNVKSYVQDVSQPKRRGKRPRTYTEDDDDVDEPRSKAAQQAKRNRDKKKQYVSGLEEKVKDLEKENADIRLRMRNRDITVHQLQEEVRYLRSVLANQTTLSRLLRKIDFDSGEFSDDNRLVSDHSYSIKKSDASAQAGVCLHVSSGDISLELCSRCSRQAKKSHQHDTSGN